MLSKLLSQVEKEPEWKCRKKTIWQHFEMVQKEHFMSIENGIFDPKDINRLDCMMGIGIERDRCMISTTKKIQSSSCHCR